MLKIKLLFVAILLAFFSIGQTPIEYYTRANEYGSLRLPLCDFKEIASDIEYFVKDTTSGSSNPRDFPLLKCDFRRDEKTITLTSFNQVKLLNLEKESYTEVSLVYNFDNQPITEANLSLGNRYRKLTVKGTDEKKVQALYRAIDESIHSKEYPVPLQQYKEFVMGLAWLVFSFSFFSLKNVSEKASTIQNAIKKAVWYAILIVISGIVVVLYSVNKINFFPDLLLAADSSSWTDRNTNLLGLIGFYITVITLLFSIAKYIYKTIFK
ncbi:hypothetical protein [Adhaeribacter radiodurans]|uniref:Uncharacterized protein n=1 Tax=Adhaeribacter radiodurans TaxID=2745197 RepID=A0A7L7L7J0_9BACT|nr:hypothetical protein [Adhaeribacter radiodurans]QMU28770.1 hypothetical protein HUW48_12315 [Adhaeribacter radiodurans]